MNKIMFFVAAMALAATSVQARTVPTPPVRPADFTATNGVGALVTPSGVIVKAPLGSNVSVDVDGKDVEIEVEDAEKTFWKRVLPWNWNLWH